MLHCVLVMHSAGHSRQGREADEPYFLLPLIISISFIIRGAQSRNAPQCKNSRLPPDHSHNINSNIDAVGIRYVLNSENVCLISIISEEN